MNFIRGVQFNIKKAIKSQVEAKRPVQRLLQARDNGNLDEGGSQETKRNE